MQIYDPQFEIGNQITGWLQEIALASLFQELLS
jgi:hypothetical protein